MFLMHPLCLLLSFCGAAACLLCVGGRNAFLAALRGALPVVLLAAALNVLFNHRGQTILFYLPGGNPCTLESLCYGAAAGALLAAVLLWFACCTRLLTTDHFTYLFARISPALSLLFSMTLRFLPQFKRRFLAVRRAQSEPQTKRQALRTAFRCFWAVVAWALERAGDTADSMKGRGYGLAKRSAYAVYTHTARDRLLLGGLGLCALCVLCGCVMGLFRFSYAPRLLAPLPTPQSACAFFGYAALCAYPALILKLEDRPWHSFASTT